MKIVAVGDFTCKSEAEKTLDNIKRRNPDLVLALGDFSYKEEIDCFLEKIEDKIPQLKDKIKAVLGNHEDDEEIDSEDADKMKQRIKEEFGIQSFFYSFDIDNMHFLILNSQQGDYEVDSEQHIFAKADLEKVTNNSNLDWIIVCYHKPTITSGTDHPPEIMFRDIYHDLFDRFKVDLILTGHNHNYQRSNVIIHDPQAPSKPKIIDSGDGKYDTRLGRIFIVVGTGGRRLDRWDKDEPEPFIKKRFRKNGVFSIELEDRRRFKCQFVSNQDDQILDEFIIDKSGVL